MCFSRSIVLLFFLTNAAFAQAVYKCKDVNTGQIIFSDTGCPKTHKTTEIRDKPSEAEVDDYYTRAEEARRRNEANTRALVEAEAGKGSGGGNTAVMNAGRSQECISAQRELKLHTNKDNRTAANIACMGTETAGKIEQENAKNTRKPMKCLPDGNGGYNCF